jgi:hypothetical protein
MILKEYEEVSGNRKKRNDPFFVIIGFDFIVCTQIVQLKQRLHFKPTTKVTLFYIKNSK